MATTISKQTRPSTLDDGVKSYYQIPIDTRKIPDTYTTPSTTTDQAGGFTYTTDADGNPIAVGQATETIIQNGVTTTTGPGSYSPAGIGTEPTGASSAESPADIFRAWNRTGAEVGGAGSQTFGQSRGASGVRNSMADALRIGSRTASRTATARTLDRKKQRNTLGLNIGNPGIGLQI